MCVHMRRHLARPKRRLIGLQNIDNAGNKKKENW